VADSWHRLASANKSEYQPGDLRDVPGFAITTALPDPTSSGSHPNERNAMETTLIILKPDAVQRGLMGTILERFERKGLRIAAMKMMMVPRDLAETHYGEHKEKPFFPGLIDFITSSPVVVLAIQGINAIAVSRKLIGATNGQKAEPGTIRGDFGMSGGYNMIHGSDSPESAQRELALWFKDGEIVEFEKTSEKWVYDPSDL
jgi:nucleoside-diphosphate kinase